MSSAANLSKLPISERPPVAAEAIEDVSVVIPVYRGELTLPGVIESLLPYTSRNCSAAGARWQIGEVILVHDGAVDGSAQTIETLADKYSFVRPIWLSRNFGQHAATLAGMASAAGKWVVTIDEDGQQNPADVPAMLDVALGKAALVVYASPRQGLPHTNFRNAASHGAKWVFARLTGSRHGIDFNSFRLMDGEIARSLAAYCGVNVYLDGALNWVTDRIAACPVSLRADDRRSGYNLFRLLSHFKRLLMTSNTSPLRVVSALGLVAIIAGVVVASWAFVARVQNHVQVPGWASLTIITCFFSGLILFSLGVMAEYLCLLVGVAMGRPLYLILSKRAGGKRRP